MKKLKANEKKKETDKKATIKKSINAIKPKKQKKEPYSSDPVRIRLVVTDDDDNSSELEYASKVVDGVRRVKSTRSPEDEIFESLNGSDRKNHFRFEPNARYYTICVYAFFFIIAASLVVMGIAKIDVLKNTLLRFLSVIAPFIAGLMIAFVLDPLVDWLDKKVFLKLCKLKSVALRKVFSILVTYILVLGLVAVLLIYVSPQIGNSFIDLYNKSDNLTATLLDYINRLERFIPGMATGFFEEKISEMLPRILEYMTELAPKLLSLSVSIAKFAFNTLLAIAISIYALYDKRKLKLLAYRITYAILPLGRANHLTHTTKECVNIFGGFIFGKSLDSLIIGIICFILLTIFKFPYAVLVSVIVGVTNMIPYFGPFIGAIPGVLLYLTVSPMDALFFAFLILCLQQFDGWVLGPIILGDSTGLSPLWVIFAITVGGAYAGVLGMFLGVPVVAVLSYLFNHLITGRLNKQKIDVS